MSFRMAENTQFRHFKNTILQVGWWTYYYLPEAAYQASCAMLALVAVDQHGMIPGICARFRSARGMEQAGG